MQLRIPHVAGSGESGDSNILAASRPQIGEKWTDGSTRYGPQVIQCKGGSITLAVYHFTGFAAFFRNLVSILVNCNHSQHDITFIHIDAMTHFHTNKERYLL